MAQAKKDMESLLSSKENASTFTKPYVDAALITEEQAHEINLNLAKFKKTIASFSDAKGLSTNSNKHVAKIVKDTKSDTAKSIIAMLTSALDGPSDPARSRIANSPPSPGRG